MARDPLNDQVPSPPAQARFWNLWNMTFLAGRSLEQNNLDAESVRRADTVLQWLGALGPASGRILEVGCGTGWLTKRLASYGRVTGIDLADQAIAVARERNPDIEFIAGDVATITLPPGEFEVIVSLETLACLPNQADFIASIARLLRPGGHVLLTAHHRFVYQRRSDVAPLAPGQVRRWLSRPELRRLLQPHFHVLRLVTIIPTGDRGLLRLINSHKVNGLARLFLSERTIRRFKEALGFGTTLVVLARKRVKC